MSKNNKSKTSAKGIWARVRLGPAGQGRRTGTEVMGDTEYNRRFERREAQKLIAQAATENGIEEIIKGKISTGSIHESDFKSADQEYFLACGESKYFMLGEKLKKYLGDK